MSLRTLPTLPALLAGLLLAACASVTNPVTGERELTVMDERAEIAEGAKAHPQIVKEYGVVADAGLQAYVSEVGQRLAAQSHRANLKWRFTVLDSPEVNAFALPGGYVYVTRGILAYLDSEADLAGVLGHEIGHVTARHGAQAATRQARAGVGVFAATLGGVLLEAIGVPGAAQAASDLSRLGAAGLIARYGRDQELQADQLGAEYLARTRYDPGHMVEVIQVLKDQERFAAEVARAAGRAPPEGAGWLASHPSNDQRLAEIRSTATRLAGGRPGGWADGGRARYLQAIEGLGFGDGRAQGVVRGRNFFHEPLGVAITAPVGWRIANGSDALTLINGAGDAALVMKLVPPDVVERTGSSHEAILRGALGATEGRAEKLTLGGGLPATFFAGTRRDRQGAVGVLEATVVSGPVGQVFVLGRVARDSAARERARGALREAELSFRTLDGAERAAARPWRVRVVPFPPGGFAALARSSPIAELPEQQLRLLNGVYGERSDPKRGERVKVIE